MIRTQGLAHRSADVPPARRRPAHRLDPVAVYVDTSALYACRHGIVEAFAFDDDFAEQGFTLVP